MSDYNRLLNGAEDSINKLGNCFDTLVDERKTKMNVVGSIFGFGASLTKLAFTATGCAVKNIPRAVVAVAAVKRDIVSSIEKEMRESEKQRKVDALEEKIKQLSIKV